MFVNQDLLKPIVEGLGFSEFYLDLSNSEMSFEIEEEEAEESKDNK